MAAYFEPQSYTDDTPLIGSGGTVNEFGRCPSEDAAMSAVLAAKPAVTARSSSFAAAGPSADHSGIIFAERGKRGGGR